MKNKKLLDEFTKFCSAHPELRFWQSLCAWSGAEKILYESMLEIEDTFYWNEKSEVDTTDHKKELIKDVLSGKFGTKNRSELLTRLEKL